MKKVFKALIALGLLGGAAAAQTRPHSPFVEKCVTPERSRQLKVALDAKLWIMYDMPTAELYMAWPGGADGGTLKNATYWYGNQTHFPHWFYITGNPYFKEPVGEFFSDWAKPSDITLYYTRWPKQPTNYKNWSVTVGGSDVFAHVANHGYFINGNVFKFHNGLILKDGSEIDVTEVPEFDGTGGKTGLTRKFTFTGIPSGGAVKLSLPTGGNWTGTGVAGNVLTVSADGSATISGSW